MKKNMMLRALGLAALATLAACSTAEQAATEPPLPPSTSTEQAEGRLAAVALERSAIEARYAEREIICYDKFFVNRCLDEAKEERRVDLLAQRAIEIEAGRYLRQAKVDERERAMAAAEAQYQKEEARLAADPAPVKTPAAAPKPRAKPAASRAERSRERAQQDAARAEQDAATRAANVAAFEERKRKSEERQKEVARRVAEREAAAARSAAAEAAKKNPGTPAPAPAE